MLFAPADPLATHVNIAEAARALGVARRTLYYHIAAGTMPALGAFKVPGFKAWRVPVANVRALLAERRAS